MTEKSDKNILVITPHFLAFVHDQVIELAKYYRRIDVIVVYPRSISIKSKGIKLSNKMKVDRNNIPSNVNIYEDNYFTIPGKKFQHLRGKSSYKKVKNLITQHNLSFNLVHSHFLWPSGYIGSKLKQEYKVPFIVTGHGYDVYDLPFRTTDWTNRIKAVLKAADAVITVSNKNKEFLSKIINRKIDVIPNGYNNDIFKPGIEVDKEKLNIPLGKKIILSVGNLNKVKGHIHLINSIETVAKQHDVFSIIIGGGNQYKKLTESIKNKGLENRIKLTGPLPPDQIPLWMNACDIYVQPSLNESFGIVLLEAMSCGKPVIGSNVGGIPEIITNDKYGMLVPPGDSKRLADVISLSLNSNWDSSEIKKYADNFKWESITKRIIAVYNPLLE